MIIVCPKCNRKTKFPDQTDWKKKYIYKCAGCNNEFHSKDLHLPYPFGGPRIYRGEQEKDWEHFEKLSSQEKLENLWQCIWDLQKGLDVDRTFYADKEQVEELTEKINSRFRKIYEYLDSLGARTAVFEELVSVKSSGPVNMPCPDCGKLSVVRKRSEYSPEDEYVLECLSCGWSKEIEY